MHYPWRAVDHEGEALESFVTKARNKAAALKFIKRAMKRHLISRALYKESRSAALAEWRSGAQSWPKPRLGLGSLRLAEDRLPLD